MAGYVNIDPREIYFDASGGREFIEARIDSARIGNGWEIDTTQDLWCEIRIAERYSTTTSISITAEQNPEPEMRTLDVDIYFDGDIVDTIYIEQEAGEAEIYSYSVTPTSLSFTSSGESKTLTTSTDSPYSWSVVSKPAWITTSVSSGKITVTASENPNTSIRTGTVQVRCGTDFTQNISVSQEALVLTTSVSKTSLTVGSAASSTATVSLSANYNAEWTSFEELEWCSATISGNNSKNATLTIKTSVANNGTNARSGIVYLTADNGDTYQISVSQSGSSPSSNVTPTYWEVKSNGGTVTASLSANWAATWSTQNVPNWITPSISNNRTNNATLTLTVAANRSASERVAAFIVKNDNYSYNVGLKQETDGYTYSISPTSMSFTSSSATKTATITSNGNASYTVNSKPEWCTVTFTGNNSASTTVNVTASANTVTDSRSGTVKINTNNGSVLSISVSQTGVAKTTSVEKTSISVGKTVSATASIALSANYNCWWAPSEEIEWCGVSVTNNGSKSATLVITTSVANNSINTRNGNIYLTADNGDQYTVSVTQNASSPSSNVNPKYWDVGYSGGTVTAALTANWGASWSTADVPSWITPTITNNYTNNATLSLKVASYSQATGRIATFTVKNDKHTYSVSVNQAGAGYSFTIDPTSMSFGSSGGTKTSTITANGNGSYTVKSKPDWCTVTFTNNNSSNTTVNVVAAANTVTDSRTGTVKITTNDSQELNISVSQVGIPKTTSVSSTSATLGNSISKTASISLNANYNAEWKATEEIEWCTTSITSNNTKSATLVITSSVTNGAITSRSGSITLTADNGDEYTISVTQEGAVPYSDVLPKSFAIKYEGDTVSANLNANWGASWSTSSVPDWISTSISSNYTNNAVLTITVSENKKAYERSGKFTVKNDKHSFEVTVNQETGGFTYDVNPTSLSFGYSGSSKTVTLSANGNVTYDVSSKPDWISVSFKNNGTESVTATITASASNTTDNRSGKVYLGANGTTNVLLVSVTQEGIPKETSVTTESITVGKAIGATGTATLSANYNAEWRVSEEIEWLSCEILNNNTKSATLQVTTTVANDSINTRTGKVIVTDDIGNEYNIQVTQQSAAPSSHIYPTSIEEKYEGGKHTVDLKANYSATWRVTSKPSWVTATISNNYTNDALLSVVISKNSDALERRGQITVENNYTSHTISLKQEGEGYTYNIDPTTLNFDYTSTTQSVVLTANAETIYIIKSKPDWCTVTLENNGGRVVTAKITVAEHNSKIDRSDTIVFDPQTGVTLLNLKVNQAAKAQTFKITPNSGYIGGVGGSVTFDLESNYDTAWYAEVTKGSEWAKLKWEDNGTKKVLLTVSADANPYYEGRFANIKVYCDGYEKILVVNQGQGTPYIDIDKTSVEFEKEGGSIDIIIDPNYIAYFECLESVDWITCELVNNRSTQVTLRISVQPNAYEARNATVTVNCLDQDVNWSAEVTVLQKGAAESWKVTPTLIITSLFGGTYEMVATANYKTDWLMEDVKGRFNHTKVTKLKVDDYNTKFIFEIGTFAYPHNCTETNLPNAQWQFQLKDTKEHIVDCVIEGLAINPEISNKDVEFDEYGGILDVQLTSGSYFELESCPSWVKATLSKSLFDKKNPTRNTQILTIECPQAEYINRMGTITVNIQPDGCKHYINVIQMTRNTNTEPNAICEPRVIEITANQAEYHLYKDLNLIYTGTAYKFPTESKISFELNDTLSNYLSNQIQFTTGAGKMPDFMHLFWVQADNGYQNTFYTYNSWEVPKKKILNDPISNIVDPRQYIFVNYLDTVGTMKLVKDGSSTVCTSDEINGFYYTTKEIRSCGSKIPFKLMSGSNQVDSIEFVYGDGSKHFVLYYVNAYGGWDSLLIGGNVKKTDSFNSSSYRNKQRGKVKYMNEITSSWTLYTDDMNDGSKMYHLLESTDVYLHNLKNDEIIPVVITDTNCEYKTYSNQGNKRFNYTINVEESKYKYRK